jgi:hypothetical protein
MEKRKDNFMLDVKTIQFFAEDKKRAFVTFYKNDKNMI